MKILPSAAEMRIADSATIGAGVSALELMERAGRAIFEEVCKRKGERKVVVVCGTGNNGGDGLVVSRLLKQAGHHPMTLVCAVGNRSPEFVIQLEKLHQVGGEAIIGNARLLLDALTRSGPDTLVVDALLGTGQSGAARGEVAELISTVNQFRSTNVNSRVLAVDLPSGIDSSSGELFRPCIKADWSVAIEALKRGMVQQPAAGACGEIVVRPIGISFPIKPKFSLAEQGSVIKIPVRPKDAHKGSFGRVVIVAGSDEMSGAAYLAALAALRVGAGLVEAADFGGGRTFAPEVITISCQAGSKDGELFSAQSKQNLQEAILRSECLVIGPGLFGNVAANRSASTSNHLGATEILELIRVAARIQIPMIIDADGLSAVKLLGTEQRAELGVADLSATIITPHPGEAARLLDSSILEVQRDRYRSAEDLANLTGGVAILKGHSTVVCDQSSGFVNTTGNPFMATAGSGDVLAGILGGLAAQKWWRARYSLLEVATLGVFLHGLAGDIAASQQGAPLIASDIIGAIPAAYGVVSEQGNCRNS